MRILRGLNGDTQNFQGGTLTIGKFDGLHLGHQQLIRSLKHAPKIVITFDPLPIQVLKPDQGFHRLMPKSDLEEQLQRYGVDALLILPFTAAMAAQSAAQFAETVFQPFRPQALIVGYDFAMGRNREGNLEWLKSWCAQQKINLQIAPPFQLDGQTVSSGRVREMIRQGSVDHAAQLLGRPFYIRGEVIQGAGRGRTIGVPTLNQRVENETLPALGVYASRTKWRGQLFASVTNVGRVPTFTDQTQIHVETHVLDQTTEARGDTVDVELIQRLRPEMKFTSVEDLKKQIKQDILNARRIL